MKLLGGSIVYAETKQVKFELARKRGILSSFSGVPAAKVSLKIGVGDYTQ